MIDNFQTYTSFGRLRNNQEFIYKPIFDSPMLLKKIKPLKIAGITYNSINPATKNYYYFDDYTEVRIQ